MKPDKWRKQSGGNSRFRPQDDKLSCGQLAPRQGAKPACRSAFLMGVPVKSAFELLLARVTEPAADAAKEKEVIF